MSNIIMFVDNEWALGSIHVELLKQFYKIGINSNLLFWGKNYTTEEILEMNDSCDSILTTPHGYIKLRQMSNFKIPQNKFIVIAHAVLDLQDWLQTHSILECTTVKNFGVVSKFLQEEAIKLGYPKKPELCEIGINFEMLYSKPSSQLRIVGYGSTYWDRNALPIYYENQPAAKKRSYLAKEATEAAGLIFKVAQRYHNSFVTMPGFYRNIDALIMSSSEEGAGLPVIEAGASGRLVISTPVGHVVQRSGSNGADIVSIPEKKFLEETISLLSMYKSNDDKYMKRCKEIQEYARKYDWSNCIDSWSKLL